MRGPWHRVGFYYYCTLIYAGTPYDRLVTKELDFIAYHMIRLFHGEDKLLEMAREI